MDRELYNDPEISNAELINRDTFERLMAKKKHKKIFRRINYILLSIVLCFIFVVTCMALFLKIENIEVYGNNRYKMEQIIESSGITVGQNLYAINKKTARSAIMTDYPYIDSVTIRRKLPATLTFRVTEELPKYYTEICGEYFILSDTLRVLERCDELVMDEEQPLVKLLMSDINSAVVGEQITFDKVLTFEYLLDFIQALKGHDVTKHITEIDLSRKYNIYVMYQDRFEIYLGDSTDMDMKLTFAKLMIDTFEPEQAGSVDAHDITVGSVILDN